MILLSHDQHKEASYAVLYPILYLLVERLEILRLLLFALCRYLLPLVRKKKPLRPFFLGPQNKTAMPDNSYVCKLRSFQRARHRFACGGLRSCVLCRFARLVVGCDWPTMTSDYNRPPEQWQANDIWWYWWQTRAKTSSQHRQTLYRIEALN